MSYVAQADLAGVIPADYLLSALDDNSDGVADPGVWDAIAAAVDEAIDAFLAPCYTVPISSPPDVVTHAAKVLASEMVYRRRGVSSEANPWTKEADGVRERLAKIGAGEIPRTSDAAKAQSGGSAITEAARLTDESGRLLV